MSADGFSLLHTFTDAPDGAFPEAGVIRVAAGTLYGTTQSGGNGCLPGSCGTVYQVTSSGPNRCCTAYRTGTTDGVGPVGSLYGEASGDLFGPTRSGGIQNVFGTAFEVKPIGAESVLHLLAQSPDGAVPQAGFVSDVAGNLYGTTALGNNNGTALVAPLCSS